jgi:two-component system LytT family response regulator
MNRELTAVIIDDEAHCHDALTNLLDRRHPDIILAGSAWSVTEGLEMVSRLKPDILFLDVEIGDRTGFELLQALGPQHPHVIFTTAHESYALKAIRFSALHFLLKPIDVDELSAAIDKVKRSSKRLPDPMHVLSLLSNLIRLKDGQLSVTTDLGLKNFNVETIRYFTFENAQVLLNSMDMEPVTLTCAFQDCVDLMSEHQFIRINRTAMINVRHVKEVQASSVVMNDGSIFAFDVRKLDELRMAIAQ